MATPLLRRAGSHLLKLLDRLADPATVAGSVQLYGKAVGGTAEFFVCEGNGVVDQMTGPGAIMPQLYVKGLALSWISVSQVQIAAGRARDWNNDKDDIILAANTTADITVAGINGLDAGAEAASTWYAIWIIGDSTKVNPSGTLISASFSAPTLPAGYDLKRRIGCVRNSSGSDFLRFFQKGKGRTRRYYYDESRTTCQVLTNGSATVQTSIANMPNRAPPSSQNVLLGLEFLAPTVGGANTDQLQLYQAGLMVPPMIYRLGQTTTSSFYYDAELPLSSAQLMDYLVSDPDDVANIYVLGFDDEI